MSLADIRDRLQRVDRAGVHRSCARHDGDRHLAFGAIPADGLLERGGKHAQLRVGLDEVKGGAPQPHELGGLLVATVALGGLVDAKRSTCASDPTLANVAAGSNVTRHRQRGQGSHRSSADEQAHRPRRHSHQFGEPAQDLRSR